VNIAVIGGGGLRTPLLVNGLVHSDLPIRRISLFDADERRLEIIGNVARYFADGSDIRLCSQSAEAITGADFVLTSIRVGGIAQRARDEAATLAQGIVGQETVGPAGFAMAVRTIPHLVRYAREVESLAPRAWIINFTNPVGIVTQAVRQACRAKIIGICDTPTELFEEVAHALGLSSHVCHFDYFGLNHLGWLREVYHEGIPQLARIWTDRTRLRTVYRTPLFEPDYLAELKLLPTEYVYYYVRAQDAVDNMRRAGETRGQVICRLNDELFRDLAEPGADVISIYQQYLASRNAGYMQLESGSPRQSSSVDSLTGYDKIALSVVRSIHFNSGAVIPLNVPNNGNLPLEDDDVVEVPCVVNANGAWPAHVPPPPRQIAEFIGRVKAYERLTIHAAITRTVDAAVDALASNPLVADRALARRLYETLAPLW
jgi:6-phospho-beta-glucosidase